MSSAEVTNNDPAIEALRIARELFDHSPDWVEFFHKVLGVDGVVRKLFPSLNDRQAFENTDGFRWIMERLSDLRLRDIDADDALYKRGKVITVRIPESLHKALKEEARDRRTSLNQLAINCLLGVARGAEAV